MSCSIDQSERENLKRANSNFNNTKPLACSLLCDIWNSIFAICENLFSSPFAHSHRTPLSLSLPFQRISWHLYIDTRETLLGRSAYKLAAADTPGWMWAIVMLDNSMPSSLLVSTQSELTQHGTFCLKIPRESFVCCSHWYTCGNADTFSRLWWVNKISKVLFMLKFRPLNKR